jgi:hypothetical protein
VDSAVRNIRQDIQWAFEDAAAALSRAGVSQSRFPRNTGHTQAPATQLGLLLRDEGLVVWGECQITIYDQEF